MEMEFVVWAIVRDGAGRVLLGRRSGTGRGEGLWNLPGGHVDPGEPAAVAAAREACEEVGVIIAPTDLEVVGVERWEQGGSAGLSIFLSTTRWDGVPIPLENTSETGWFALDALPPDCLPWLPAALRMHLRDDVVWAESLG